MPLRDLATRLTEAGYAGLFLRHPPPALALHAEPGAAAALAALAADPAAAPEPRFLAAEVIAAATGALPAAPPSLLAAAYAAALRDTSLPNIWGLPGAPATAPVRNLVALGEAGAAALRPLLADRRVLDYAGSEDATIGNAASWRVADAAAAIIAAIRGLRFDAAADPAARDLAIARLLAEP